MRGQTPGSDTSPPPIPDTDPDGALGDGSRGYLVETRPESNPDREGHDGGECREGTAGTPARRTGGGDGSGAGDRGARPRDRTPPASNHQAAAIHRAMPDL